MILLEIEQFKFFITANKLSTGADIPTPLGNLRTQLRIRERLPNQRIPAGFDKVFSIELPEHP